MDFTGGSSGDPSSAGMLAIVLSLATVAVAFFIYNSSGHSQRLLLLKSNHGHHHGHHHHHQKKILLDSYSSARILATASLSDNATSPADQNGSLSPTTSFSSPTTTATDNNTATSTTTTTTTITTSAAESDSIHRAQLIKDLLEEEERLKAKKAAKLAASNSKPSSNANKKRYPLLRNKSSISNTTTIDDTSRNQQQSDSENDDGDSSQNGNNEDNSINDLLLLSSLSSKNIKESKRVVNINSNPITITKTPSSEAIVKKDGSFASAVVASSSDNASPALDSTIATAASSSDQVNSGARNPSSTKSTSIFGGMIGSNIADTTSSSSEPSNSPPSNNESAISSSIKPPPGIPVPLHRQTSQVNQQIIDSPNNRHRHQKQNSSSTNTGRNNNINNQQQHQQSCLAAERDALSTELKVLKDTHRIMTQSLVGAQHTNQDSSKKIIRLENELSSLRKLVLGMQQQQHHQLTHSSTMDKASELRLKQEHAALMIQNTEQQKFIQTLRTETQRLQQVVLGYEDAAVRDRSNHTLSMTEAAKTMSALKAQIGAYETKVADLVKSQSKDVEERANLMERCKQLGEDLMRAVEDKKALMGEKKKVMEDKSKAIQDSFKYQAEVQAAKEKHKLSDSKNSSIIAALEKKVADLEKQLVEPTSKHDSEECSHVDESSDDESANRKNVTVDEQKTINETATAIKDEIAAAWSGKSSPDALITSSYEIISGESPSALQA